MMAAPSAGVEREKPDHPCPSGGDNKLVQTLWKTIWPFLNKLNMQLSMQPSNYIPGRLSNRNEDVRPQ